VHQTRDAPWALNFVVTEFDLNYLALKRDVGGVCVDRLDPRFGYEYLRRRFQEPLDLPDGRSPTLNRIVHYSMSCDGRPTLARPSTSLWVPFASGVNSAIGSGNPEVATQMFP
jgi:hypothetical protein